MHVLGAGIDGIDGPKWQLRRSFVGVGSLAQRSRSPIASALPALRRTGEQTSPAQRLHRLRGPMEAKVRDDRDGNDRPGSLRPGGAAVQATARLHPSQTLRHLRAEQNRPARTAARSPAGRHVGPFLGQFERNRHPVSGQTVHRSFSRNDPPKLHRRADVPHRKRFLHFDGSQTGARHFLDLVHVGETNRRSGSCLSRHRLGFLRRQRFPHPNVRPCRLRGLPDGPPRTGSHPILYGIQLRNSLHIDN